MKLRKVDIRNFRCFDNISVPLNEDVTVIVGINGTGKTAILDAIAVALARIPQRLSSAAQRLKSEGIRDTDFRIMPSTQSDRQPTVLADYARVALETHDGVAWDYWRPSGQKGAEPPDKLGLSALDEYIAPWQPSQSETSPSPPMPVFAYYGPDRGLLDIPGRLHRSKTDFSQRTSALVGALDARTNFKECLQWFDAAEADELRANRDRTDGEFDETTQLHAVRRAIRTVFGETIENPRFVVPSHKLVVDSVMPGGETTQLRVDQLSHGYQAMLAMIIDFARRQALANPDYRSPDTHDSIPSALREPDPWSAPGIILIDEIDLHLHPSWQQRVIQDLRRAFPNTQILATTHSPQVLTTVYKESVLVFRSTEGRWELVPPEFQTRGVESADVLASIMGVDPVPKVEEAQWLADYRAFIETGKAENGEATQLREKLVAHFGQRHPLILDCDRLIRFQAFKQRRSESGRE